MAGIIIWIVLIALAIALLWFIINSKMGEGGGGRSVGASVFADMQNQEKRNAMETVIEMKGGKKQFEQESGEKGKPGGEKN